MECSSVERPFPIRPSSAPVCSRWPVFHFPVDCILHPALLRAPADKRTSPCPPQALQQLGDNLGERHWMYSAALCSLAALHEARGEYAQVRREGTPGRGGSTRVGALQVVTRGEMAGTAGVGMGAGMRPVAICAPHAICVFGQQYAIYFIQYGAK